MIHHRLNNGCRHCFDGHRVYVYGAWGKHLLIVVDVITGDEQLIGRAETPNLLLIKGNMKEENKREDKTQ